MKKLFSLLLSIVLLFSVLTLPAFAEEEKESTFPLVSGSSKVILYHMESDRIVYRINPNENEHIAPASMVKIMTGILAIEYLSTRLDEKITVTSEMLKGVEGVKIGLSAGDRLTVNDLLYCFICGGGNDAAYVIAYISCGSVDAFVEKMNAKAVELKMTNTYYKNPTGIDDPEMYTTLEDTLLLSRFAAENDMYVTYSSAKNYTFKFVNSNASKVVSNRNAQISTYTESGYVNKNAKGLNAGMTDNGGYCISSYATNGEDSYICVVMGAVTTANGRIGSYSIANTLINHAYNYYTYTVIANKGDKLGKIVVDNALPINGSQAVTADCVLENDIYGYVVKDLNYLTDLEYRVYFHEESLNAPVSPGEIVGGVDVYYDGKLISSGRLVTSDEVVASDLLLILEAMRNIILSRNTLVFVLAFVIMVVLYYFLFVVRRRKKWKNGINSEPNLYRRR